VQALVFIAGWMPDEGESIQQLSEAEAFGDSLVPAALRPVPFENPDGSEGVDLYLDRELFPETFAADVDPETARVMAATQRPWSGVAVHSQGLAPGSVTVSRPACSPTLKGCDGRPVNGRYRGGRPGAGRIGAMAVPPPRRGPDHRAGTASTAAATAYAARS
jgi:hypothetical protein